MLKTQEIEIDGEKFKIREPRIKDHLRAKALVDASGEAYAISMLSGMLIDEAGKEVGEAFISDLPLRVFNQLAEAMEAFSPRPLDPNGEPSTE
jgi:hypothetical protein